MIPYLPGEDKHFVSVLHKSVNKCSANLAQTSSYCDDGHDRWADCWLAKNCRTGCEDCFKIIGMMYSIIEGIIDVIYSPRCRRQFPKGAIPHAVSDPDSSNRAY